MSKATSPAPVELEDLRLRLRELHAQRMASREEIERLERAKAEIAPAALAGANKAAEVRQGHIEKLAAEREKLDAIEDALATLKVQCLPAAVGAWLQKTTTAARKAQDEYTVSLAADRRAVLAAMLNLCVALGRVGMRQTPFPGVALREDAPLHHVKSSLRSRIEDGLSDLSGTLKGLDKQVISAEIRAALDAGLGRGDGGRSDLGRRAKEAAQYLSHLNAEQLSAKIVAETEGGPAVDLAGLSFAAFLEERGAEREQREAERQARKQREREANERHQAELEADAKQRAEEQAGKDRLRGRPAVDADIAGAFREMKQDYREARNGPRQEEIEQLAASARNRG